MLTKKSMMVNGIYIESVIDGYTTTGVSGRESLESNLNTISVNNRNGEIYKGKTYTSRNLTISFAIEASSYEEANEKVEALNEYLDMENVEVSFADESDKFFNASAFTNPSIATVSYPASDKVIAAGSFDVYCADPFKYSKDVFYEEPEIVFEEDEEGESYEYPVFSVNYDGNYKAYPTFEARFYDRNKSWNVGTIDNDADEIIEQYYAVAYEPIEDIESADDFPAGQVYILDPVEATSYNSGSVYFTLEADTNAYVLADISETDFLDPEHEEYYILNERLVSSYIEDEEFYLLNSEHIIQDASNIDDDFDYPQDGDDGMDNEEIGSSGACGYVGFIDDEGHVLQFGNPEASEFSTPKANPVLANNTFNSQTSYSEKVRNKWLTNAITPPYYPTDAPRTAKGSFAEALRCTQYYASLKATQTVYNAKKSGITYTVKVVKVNTRKTGSCRVYYYVKATLNASSIKYVYNNEKHKVVSSTRLTFAISFDNGNTWATHTLLPHKKTWKKGKSRTIGSSKSPKSKIVSVASATTQSITPKIQVIAEGTRASTFDFTPVKCRAISIPVYTYMPATSYYLKPSYGVVSSGWHGPILSRLLPADGNGEFGSTDFKMVVEGKYCIGNATNYNLQQGILGVYAIGGTMSGGTLTNRKVIAGVEIRKTKTSSETANIVHIVNGKKEKEYKDVKCIKYNNLSKFAITIRKGSSDGSKPSSNMYVGFKNTRPISKKKNITVTKSYTYDRIELADTKVYMIAICFYANASQPVFSWAGIDSVKFTKYHVEGQPVNPFKAADILTVNCADCDVQLNGESALNLSALGNDWEGLCLKPGTNLISALYSPYAKEKTAYRKCRMTDSWSSITQYYTYNASTNTYVEASPTEEEFNASIAGDRLYYVLETCEPTFVMKYREVYI